MMALIGIMIGTGTDRHNKCFLRIWKHSVKKKKIKK